MVRARNTVATRRRKKRLLKKARGQFGDRSKRFSQAIKSLKKGMMYATRDRRVKKREFKRLWIVRINAACRESGLPYSRFIKGLSEAKVEIDRKILADLALNSPGVFKKLVKLSKDSLPAALAKKSTKTTKKEKAKK